MLYRAIVDRLDSCAETYGWKDILMDNNCGSGSGGSSDSGSDGSSGSGSDDGEVVTMVVKLNQG